MNRIDEADIRDAATVLVLRDSGTTGLEVLLLRRNTTHVFGPDAVVFPGGALETVDAQALRLASIAGRHWPDADWRMAALRECFEETGILLSEQIVLPTAARRRAWQQALARQQCTWFDLLKTQQLSLDLTQLLAFDEWTTPPGLARRYRARFYAVALEAPQKALVDGDEIVSARWWPPSQALRELQPSLMLPTRRILERLRGFNCAETALAGLAEDGNA